MVYYFSILGRQAEGIAIAKEQHKFRGKPKMVIDEDAFMCECKGWRNGEQTATEAMKRLDLKPNTFYRRVKENGVVMMHYKRLTTQLSENESQQFQEQGHEECKECPCYIPFIILMMNEERVGKLICLCGLLMLILPGELTGLLL